MHPQMDLAIHSQIIAARIRHAEHWRAASAGRPRRQLRLSLRSAFGRRPVAAAVR